MCFRFSSTYKIYYNKITTKFLQLSSVEDMCIVFVKHFYLQAVENRAFVYFSCSTLKSKL
jgi:hypothetical protein